SIFRSKLLETLHMIALQAAKLLAPPVIRKLRSRRSCEPPRQPIFLATAEHRPDAASRRSLRAYASSGAFQRPLQRLNSLLQGGPLFRGQATNRAGRAAIQCAKGFFPRCRDGNAGCPLHGWGCRRFRFRRRLRLGAEAVAQVFERNPASFQKAASGAGHKRRSVLAEGRIVDAKL